MDSIGPEALLKASSDVKLRLMRLLVEGGIHVDVRGTNQETPLILVCASQDQSEEKDRAVQFLIKKRAKMNLQDAQGRTALIHACISDSSETIVSALLEARANPWIEDETKNTAFDYCINKGNLDRVRALITACREKKILTKPGSFNIEMKRLEERLDLLPETRKCSWPLMGPRNSPVAEGTRRDKSAYTPTGAANSNLLTVTEEQEATSPTQQRRRKRSICHFDSIDVEEIAKAAQSELAEAEIRAPKPVRRDSLFNTSRSASEDEKISLHFSDSEGSSFDRTSISGLEKLLWLRDSASSSVESAESLTHLAGPSLTVKVDDAWINDGENDKGKKVDGISTTQNDEGFDFAKQPHQNKESEKNLGNRSASKERPIMGTSDNSDKRQGTKSNEHNQQKSSRPSSGVFSGVTTNANTTPRRKTLSAFANPSDYSSSPHNTDCSKTRRYTVSVVDQERLRPCIQDQGSRSLSPQPPKTPPKDSFSKNFSLRPRNAVSPVRDWTTTTNQDVNRDRKHEGKQRLEGPASTEQADSKSVNLPAIVNPSEHVHKISLPDLEGCHVSQGTSAKTSVRRTLSDSTNIERRRKPERETIGRNRSSSNCNTADEMPRGAGSSTPPDGQPSSGHGLERRARSPNTLSTRCDILPTNIDPVYRIRATQSKLSSDLPDLILHTPRSNTLSPNNFDTFSSGIGCFEIETVKSPRRSPSPHSRGNGRHSPVSFITSASSHALRTNEQLPEVVGTATGSPKKQVAFLPPLTVPTRKPSESEEGYFSSTPSPFDDKNRGEQPRYSFKPISPRLTGRSLGKQF